MPTGTVDEHVESLNVKDSIITPGHEERKASAEFERNVRQLKADGHYVDFVTRQQDGEGEDNLQVHHFGCEWSESHLCDFDNLKALLMKFDIYGYSAKMKDIPLTSVDDIRNLMVLKQKYHTGVDKDAGTAVGIHYLVFPMWIMHLVAKRNEDPVPEEGETIADAEKRVEGAINGK